MAEVRVGVSDVRPDLFYDVDSPKGTAWYRCGVCGKRRMTESEMDGHALAGCIEHLKSLIHEMDLRSRHLPTSLY